MGNDDSALPTFSSVLFTGAKQIGNQHRAIELTQSVVMATTSVINSTAGPRCHISYTAIPPNAAIEAAGLKQELRGYAKRSQQRYKQQDIIVAQIRPEPLLFLASTGAASTGNGVNVTKWQLIIIPVVRRSPFRCGEDVGADIQFAALRHTRP